VRRFDWPWSATVLLVAMAVMMMAPRRRRIALALAGAIILAACGGGGAPVVTGTPAGSYKVVVTGTAGSVSQSVTVPVTVN
jgi:multidrug efflux pump subunit AcrA (membrane-fusion protein)